MNQITKLPTAGGVAARHPSTDARAIAVALRQIQATLREPFDDHSALTQECPGWFRNIHEHRSVQPPRSRPERDHVVAEIRASIEATPPRGRLFELAGTLGQAAGGAFDRDKARMVVALMADSFPNARPHIPEAYFEILVHELSVSGFSPHVIAEAAARVVRTAKFLPAVAEVLERCAGVKEEAEGAARRLSGAVEAINRWERQLTALAAMVDLPEEAPRYDFRSRKQWQEGDHVPF
jgi:hypothetical protein